jgi:hypothetical protein
VKLRCRPFLMGAGGEALCQQCFAIFYSCQKVLTNRYERASIRRRYKLIFCVRGNRNVALAGCINPRLSLMGINEWQLTHDSPPEAGGAGSYWTPQRKPNEPLRALRPVR